MRVHADERRTAYCDLFDTPGDVNLFIVKPGQRTCWHRHQKQTDEFRVIRGKMLFKKFRDGDYVTEVLYNDPVKGFYVPAGMWHGYENIGDDDAYLLMYLSQKYDPTDEEKMGEDEVPWTS